MNINKLPKLTDRTADSIGVFQEAEILHLDDCTLAHKLGELGFLPGRSIRLLYKAPFGDPMAFELGDSVIALRKAEARLIHIKSEILQTTPD